MVGLCKLADINHRINRARDHDEQQVAAWIENEVQRKAASEANQLLRTHKLQQLNGEGEGERDGGASTAMVTAAGDSQISKTGSDDKNKGTMIVQESVGRLRAEVDVLNDKLAAAEREEEEARKVRRDRCFSLLRSHVFHFFPLYHRYFYQRFGDLLSLCNILVHTLLP